MNSNRVIGSVSVNASCFLGILFEVKIKTDGYMHSIYIIGMMIRLMIKAVFLSQGSPYCLSAYLLLRNHSDKCSHLT